MNRRERPKVIANFAMTVDGKISTRNRTPSTFTSPADKRRLLEIRSLGDAIIVGRSTVATDTMSMTLRDPDLQAERIARGQATEPLRVIVSGSGKFDSKWRVFEADGAKRILLTTAGGAARVPDDVRALADVVECGENEVDLAQGLGILRRTYGVKTLACEGGPTLFRGLLELDAIDELYVTLAPVVFGGTKAPTMTGLPGEFLPECVRMRCTECTELGGEWYLKFRVKRFRP